MIEEHALEFMQAYCRRFGFDQFCPNLQDTPYARYNAAHRMVAIDSFKQVMTAHAYSFLGPNPSLTSDTGLLIRIYDNFWFHNQRPRLIRELTNPGTTAASAATHAQVVNRGRVCTFIPLAAALF
jgi:hypothetical protein